MKRCLIFVFLAVVFVAQAEIHGVKGGLVICIGADAAEEVFSQWKNPQFVFQCLEKDAAKVSALQKKIQAAGLYGQVSVSHWKESFLPYSDGVVNLIFGSKADAAEVKRALAPGGIAVVGGKKTVKAWPTDIDEWTHYLHGPDNNAVAQDTQIATPNHLQWQAEPKRTRDHDALASMSAMTSSKGRMFYIMDEGPTSVSHHPSDWKLIGRDAFNGKLLWKRDIDSWVTHLRYFRSGPTQLPRRLVSVGDYVFATLGLTAPISMIDAATGKTLKTFKGTDNAEEFIVIGGTLLAVVGDPEYWNRYAPKIDHYNGFVDEEEPADIAKHIAAYDVKSGKRLWTIEGANMNYLTPLSLISGGGKGFYLDNKNLHCFDLGTGRDFWKSAFGSEGLFVRNFAPTVVHNKDVVAIASSVRTSVFSVKDGKNLWESTGYAGFASPPDLFFIDGLLWATPTTAGVKVKKTEVPGAGKDLVAFDPHTGEIKIRLDKKKVWPDGHHHRCYRNKATERFIICGRRGLEFVDVTGGDENLINWWVRGVCQYGIMPANGLVYVPPNPCGCFGDSKFDGFHALSSIANEEPAAQGAVLVKGSAFRKINISSAVAKPSPGGKLWANPVMGEQTDEWATYRGNITRSAGTDAKISGKLDTRWSTRLKGKLSAVTVADKKLFVAAKDQQTVHCLDAQNGKKLWSFTAEGRVDSPPTISGNTAFFGCRAGYIYALRTSDGVLAWRFRVAPAERRTVVRDRVESIWPVSGSVLLLNGVVYGAAGHSSYLDGGLRLVGLDATTGELKHDRRIKTEPKEKNGCLPDVLLSDGKNIIMRKRRFDSSLNDSKEKSVVINSTTGLLEDTWAHRWTWSLASGINGKLLAYTDKNICGVQNFYNFLKYDQDMYPDTHSGAMHQKYARYKPEDFPIGTRLFSQDNKTPVKPEQVKAKATAGGKKKKKAPKSKSGKLKAHDHKWDQSLPFQFRALALTDGVVVGAGWKDSVKTMGLEPEGGAGSALMLLAPSDGKLLKQVPLDAEPVFDGMAIAYGNIYLPLKNGTIECRGAK